MHHAFIVEITGAHHEIFHEGDLHEIFAPIDVGEIVCDLVALGYKAIVDDRSSSTHCSPPAVKQTPAAAPSFGRETCNLFGGLVAAREEKKRGALNALDRRRENIRHIAADIACTQMSAALGSSCLTHGFEFQGLWHCQIGPSSKHCIFVAFVIS